MAKKFYIFSTLAADMRYVNHGKGGADLPEPIGEGVFIAGGANVMDRKLITPTGVMTPVDADELAYLQDNAVFKAHQENGYITVSEKAADPEVVAADHSQERDPSAPLTEGDFKDGEAPKVNAEAEAPKPAGNSRKA